MIFCFVPGLRKLGKRVFVHAFASSLKEMVKIGFSYERGNFDVTLKTGCNESRFSRETFFTANLGGKDRRIPSICENPS